MTLRQRGFTLIELLVSIAIGFILVMLAVPAYSTWTSDAEEQAAAASLADGLRFAMAEAIKRNRNVEFRLDPTQGTGSWQVGVAGDVTVLKQHLNREGSYRATMTELPAGRRIVTFNPLGGVEGQNLDTTLPFDAVNVQVPNSSRAAASASLRVLVGTNNRTGVKVCDSRLTYSATEPKGCP